MTFGDRIRARREELGMSREELAGLLEVTPSAVSNYEIGVSFPKRDIMLRLFDGLQTDPNTLFQDSFQNGELLLDSGERRLLENYRGLSPLGRQTVRTMVDALCAYRDGADSWQSRIRQRCLRPLQEADIERAAGQLQAGEGQLLRCLFLPDSVRGVRTDGGGHRLAAGDRNGGRGLLSPAGGPDQYQVRQER